MSAIVITEVVANQGRSFSFQAEGRSLAVGCRRSDGLLELRLADHSVHQCEDFDCARDLVRACVPGGCACFERRRIISRRRHEQIRH